MLNGGGERGNRQLIFSLSGVMGIVYGDIGTSPIYSFRQALRAVGAERAFLEIEVLGIISLIFWALILVVTIKYVFFVLRADNEGEGGILSLMALARGAFKRHKSYVLWLGVLGASLFCGDAVITPAISVLSAVEGLEVVAPTFSFFIVPATIGILIILFAIQRFGSGRVALVFGPIMGLWFLALGGFGLYHIFDNISILRALSPFYGVAYIILQPFTAFIAVGAVFLAVTGAEALYADLGHFGRRPIILVWLGVVFPCLVLNYLGQGAFVLAHGGDVTNPFYQMLPGWALIPMIILATAATIIASQAVITGTYSLASQAVQLGILPRLEIFHTSEKALGQVYMPRVNFLLALTVIVLVVWFGKSDNLAAAYGISVTSNMLVTTLFLFLVMWRIWKWSLFLSVGLATVFFLLDGLFFVANVFKIYEGGWISVGIAGLIGLVMATWIRGSQQLSLKIRKLETPLPALLDDLQEKPPFILPGTGVFLTSDPYNVPASLINSLKHYQALHENNVFLTVVTAPIPRVSLVDRARISQFHERFMQVTLIFGYMERPNVPRSLAVCRKLGWDFDLATTSFFLSRRSIRLAPRSNLPTWQGKLFIALIKSASDATEYFQIPSTHVVEIGTQINV
ncbi:potassium transporter Kup [Bartonella sp. DGB2]|uniref:potassium transporter Kup n=1 Tax=Bartonella sp. DGB2 TaxID=3388426 RepID=UPI00398F9926